MAITARATALKGAWPRGIRNNNPGNLTITSQKWLGKVPLDKNTDGHFEQFTDPVHGIRAAILVLKSYLKRGWNTIDEIIPRWAPPNENNTQAYIDWVVRTTDWPAHVPLELSSAHLEPLLRAIFMMENGREYKDYYSASVWAGAFTLAGIK